MQKHRTARIKRVIGGVVAIAALATPAAANAYWDTLGGTTSSAQVIAAGRTGPHGLSRVTFWTYDGWNAKPETCAKAKTEAGYIRTGSGCSYNQYGRRSQLSGTSPNSYGYGYWGGSGGAIPVRAWECSPTDEYYCLYAQ